MTQNNADVIIDAMAQSMANSLLSMMGGTDDMTGQVTSGELQMAYDIFSKVLNDPKNLIHIPLVIELVEELQEMKIQFGDNTLFAEYSMQIVQPWVDLMKGIDQD